MFRNLATHLLTHERITTTLEKAKEMRPFIERLIRRAKKGGYQGNVVLKQNLFTSKAIEHVKKVLVPRYADLPAGFTRVKYLGLRAQDRASAAYIEMIGNPIEQFEKNERQETIETNGLQTFWSWEHKIIKQEQEYFQNLIQNMEAQIQAEVESSISAASDATFNNQLKADIESKFAKKRRFLEDGLKRAQFEETIHLKQEKYNRYERLFEKYAFPIGEFKTLSNSPQSERITL